MIKVAEVVGNLNRGGIENWLKDITLQYDKENFQIDFIKFTDEEGAYDSTVTQQGARIKNVPLSLGFWKFSKQMRSLLKTEKYDVIHAHTLFMSGYVLFLASLAGIKCRVCHSHSDTRSKDQNAGLSRKIYIKIQKSLIRRFATHRVACSEAAGQSLFGKEPFQTLYCGIDFEKFKYTGNTNRHQILEDLGIPEDATIIGHVGRFQEPKNHKFIVQIFKELLKKEPNSYLLLAGDGPLEKEIREQVKSESIKNIHFMGPRDDIDILMTEIFDIFLLPSLYEGFPVVLMEAQAAGLPCLISDVITNEVEIIPCNISRRSLNDTPEVWAEELSRLSKGSPLLMSREQAAYEVKKSPFSIKKSWEALNKLYLQ